MSRDDITTAVIKQIADHHDKNPSGYREFKTTGSLVLATKQGGSMQDTRAKGLRFNHRISDVLDTLTCHHAITEALLPLKGGKQFIIVYIK